MYKGKFLLGLALLLSLATAGTALVAQTTPAARPATPTASGAPAQPPASNNATAPSVAPTVVVFMSEEHPTCHKSRVAPANTHTPPHDSGIFSAVSCALAPIFCAKLVNFVL